MLNRRTALLVGYENANRNWDKAKPAKKDEVGPTRRSGSSFGNAVPGFFFRLPSFLLSAGGGGLRVFTEFLPSFYRVFTEFYIVCGWLWSLSFQDLLLYVLLCFTELLFSKKCQVGPVLMPSLLSATLYRVFTEFFIVCGLLWSIGFQYLHIFMLPCFT